MRHFLTVIGLLLIAGHVAALPPGNSKQKQQELKALRTEINKLKVDINQTEAYKSQAVGALQQSESAISEANNMLNELQRRQMLSQSQLDKIHADMVQVREHIAISQMKIADILHTRYQKGHYEAWRLILNQQSPNTINRDLQYYTYIAKAQKKLGGELTSQLLTLDHLAEEIRQNQIGLKQIYSQKQQQRTSLETEKKRKAAALISLSKEVGDKKSRLQRMQADETNLTHLVNRLNRILQEEARQRARQQMLHDKAERAERARLAKAQQPDRISTAQPRSDPPASLVTPGTQNQQIPDGSLSGRAFTALKGRLRLPVSGAVVGRFGEPREEGSTWKGVFIRASIGQSVKAVADGKVVFSQWLRGFGNMIIVDHGGGYMSLYGQNESLVKRVGSRVNAGEGIATVGDSGGSQEAGVYFEIRQHGQPQNPLKWAPAA